MNTENQETEIKLYTPDHASILQKMHALGARLVYPRVLETNIRYENASNTLTEQGITLRLRQDSRARLTYKDGGSIADGIVSREELEVEISDLQVMALILGRLGFHAAWTYEKYRTTYEFYGAEIVIDELPYGNFTEIEGDTETIEDVLRTLEMSAAPRFTDSYSQLFRNVKLALGLTFNDLTFANFTDIAVPISVFTKSAK